MSAAFALIADDVVISSGGDFNALRRWGESLRDSGSYDYACIFYEPPVTAERPYKRIVPWSSSWRGPKDYASRYNQQQQWS